MENIKTKEEILDPMKILDEHSIKLGFKRIKGCWFSDEECFNKSKSKHPTWYGGINWADAPIMDDFKITNSDYDATTIRK